MTMSDDRTDAMPPTDGVLAFIGVTASASSINEVFPGWAQILGLAGARLEPVDLPLDCDDGSYRTIVERIRDDVTWRGALVTTHKVRLLRAARDLFDALDTHARLCGEVSCVSVDGGRVLGHAKDPITSGRALRDLLAPDHFRTTGGDVVCLGAGGAGLAIAMHLRTGRDARDRPARLALVDTDPDRLEECRSALAAVDGGDRRIQLHLSDGPPANDALVAAAPPGSLIVNATGLGKDRPGSPTSDAVTFPERAVVWELNYRGDRPFLAQAAGQADARDLRVADGWRYFIHGWSEVIAEVFDVELTADVMEALGAEAARLRA